MFGVLIDHCTMIGSCHADLCKHDHNIRDQCLFEGASHRNMLCFSDYFAARFIPDGLLIMPVGLVPIRHVPT